MSTITLPGLIDCHVHFREPGFEHKATMASEAASARAGGVLTVCEMPNTNPPTVTVEALRDKVVRANEIMESDPTSPEGFGGVDIRFFFGITEAAHLEELKTAWGDGDLRRRLCGVKLYLDHSTGNQKVDGGIVEEIFKTCAELDIPLVAHCEDPEVNAAAAQANTSKDISAHSTMRPPESEEKSIAYALSLVEKHGTPFHVAHMSTAQGVALVRQAKAKNLPVTCEVCPHHLFLSVEDYGRLGTLGKMNPPLRPREHSEALWGAIEDGTVDCVATDHAPHTLAEKQIEPPLSAPSGVPGVETLLPLLLTRLTPEQVVTLCFENPNRIFALGKEDTPCVTVDLDKKWEIHGADLHSKCGWTPFEGMEVTSKVVGIS